MSNARQRGLCVGIALAICVFGGAMPAHADSKDVVITTPRHRGSVETVIDPRTGDTIHSVVAPRQPQEQTPPTQVYIYPLVRPAQPLPPPLQDRR